MPDKPNVNAVHEIHIMWNPVTGQLSVPKMPTDTVVAFGMLEAAKRRQLILDTAAATKALVKGLLQVEEPVPPGGVQVAGARELEQLGDGKLRLVPPS